MREDRGQTGEVVEERDRREEKKQAFGSRILGRQRKKRTERRVL